MNKNNDKISDFELANLIFLTILGIGIIKLPSSLTDKVANDAWILLIIAGLMAMFAAFIMCKIGQRHVNLGFVETLRYLFGNIIGTILAVPVALYALVLTAIELRLFAEVTKIYLLHSTPIEFIILPIIFLTIILVRKGIEPITRAFGVYFFIIIIAILFILIAGFQDNDYSNLLPVLKAPFTGYLSGIETSLFAFSGFELILIVFPYLRNPGNATKVSMISIISITCLYIVMTVYCIAKLGVDETKAAIWPLMALVKSISIPGGFVENVEGILTSLWVVFAFTSLVGFLLLFSVTSQGIFKHKGNKHFAAFSMPIVYILSLQGGSVPEAIELSDTAVLYLGTYTMIVLPILMLVLSLIRGKKIE